MTNKMNQHIAMKVSWISIVINIILSVFKLLAGVFANSAAMVSDSIHSMSDVVSTFIVMVGVKMANKEADKEHPYGHERFESVTAILLSAILFLVGLGIGYSGIKIVILGEYKGLAMPGKLALIASLVSIAVKEIMYQYTRRAAKKINSGALMADAWHHRSDSLSSIGSFVGIIGARLGFLFMDPIASVVICVFIVKASVSIFIDSIGKMTDKSCDDSILAEMKRIILEQEGVLGVDQIKTRLFGDRIYVDVEISANGQETLFATHALAHTVHDAIEAHFLNVKHCMVHVNPE